jgi:mannosyl-oligosaccharide alpha-1,2-mannosidase
MMESLFYAYRLTGDTIYQDRAWEAFQSITAATEAKFGYTAIRDVMREGGSVLNDQESFWMAETLKYLFLIFDDPTRISLDEWVFNTEAHPYKRGREVNWAPSKV